MTDPAESTTTDVRGGSAIAVAIAVMNVSTYAFTILAARLMGPRPFGAFASVMNLLLVAGVVNLALQATAARRIAAEPGDVHVVEDTILLVGKRASWMLGLLFLALTPLVNSTLKLNSLPTAALLAVAVAPTTLMGAQAGVLQGERRWTPLAGIYLAAGLPRFLLGAALLWLHPTEFAALGLVAISAFAPIVVGTIALSGEREHPPLPQTGDHSPRALWWETLHNSGALLAFLALSSIDIVLARNALNPHQAGLYAGGLILVKAVMFLPQFVVVIAFPAMGSEEAARSALLGSLAVVALIGAAVTAGTWLLSSLALIFVGGHAYQAIRDELWAFAILGTVLSMLQLLVYSVLARQARASVIALWAGLGALIVVGLGATSVHSMLVRVLSVDCGLLLVLLVVTLIRLRKPATSTAAG